MLDVKNFADRGECYRPRWITASEISIALYIIRKPNSTIVLLYSIEIFPSSFQALTPCRLFKTLPIPRHGFRI